MSFDAERNSIPFQAYRNPLISTENNNDSLNIGHADTSAGVTKCPHYLRSQICSTRNQYFCFDGFVTSMINRVLRIQISLNN